MLLRPDIEEKYKAIVKATGLVFTRSNGSFNDDQRVIRSNTRTINTEAALTNYQEALDQGEGLEYLAALVGEIGQGPMILFLGLAIEQNIGIPNIPATNDESMSLIASAHAQAISMGFVSQVRKKKEKLNWRP